MKSSLKICVVGAGMSGLFFGYQLKKAGFEFVIYEKRSEVGGTWDTNTYPGLHVDVLSRNYEFPFARSHKWSKQFSPGSEVRSYFVDFARTQGLISYIRFNTEVISSTWSDLGWTVVLSDGSTELFDVVVTATGFLRAPRAPNVAGLESFSGRSFHSSQWDHSIDLSDMSLRYGVVGTGSSGVQVVTELGRTGHDVTHFIRTPQWIQVKSNRPIGRLENLLMRIPPIANFQDKRVAKKRIETDGNETWRLVPGPDRDEMNRKYRETLAREIPDPELRAKFTPTEPLGVKRIAKSPDYYRVVQQPNVKPVFGGVQRVEPKGIVDDNGVLHEFDVIVWATGFDAHAYMRPMEVIGPNGVTLEQAWQNGVYAFRAIGVPGFPNFFLLCGPFAPVNSISIPTCLADEVGYLMRLFDVAIETGKAYAPSMAATEKFVEEIREALPGTTYSEGNNWYSQSVGTPIIWPFTRQKHHEQYEELNMSDFDSFEMTRRESDSTAS